MRDADTVHAGEIASSVQRWTEQVSHLAANSAVVVDRRLRIGCSALFRPDLDAALEAGAMVREKGLALAAAWTVTAELWADLAATPFGYLAEDVALAGAEGDLAGLTSGMADRAVSRAFEMAAKSTRFGAAALAPFLAATEANAARLGRAS